MTADTQKGDENNETVHNYSRVDPKANPRQFAERSGVLAMHRSTQQSSSLTTTTVTRSCTPASRRSPASGTSWAKRSLPPKASRSANGASTDSHLSLVSSKKLNSHGDDTLTDRRRTMSAICLGDDIFTIWAEPDSDGDMRTAQNLAATNVETVVDSPARRQRRSASITATFRRRDRRYRRVQSLRGVRSDLRASWRLSTPKRCARSSRKATWKCCSSPGVERTFQSQP